MSKSVPRSNRRALILAGLAFGAAPLAIAAVLRHNSKPFEETGRIANETMGGKIVVREFFSYGCPHCFAFSPIISKWKKSLPADVVVIRSHVSFGVAGWEKLAAMYFALDGIGVINSIDDKIFKEVDATGVEGFLKNDAHLDWLAKNGVDMGLFSGALPQATSAALAANELAMGLNVRAVPSVVVADRFIAKGASLEERVTIASEMIHKVRGEMQSARPA